MTSNCCGLGQPASRSRLPVSPSVRPLYPLISDEVQRDQQLRFSATSGSFARASTLRDGGRDYQLLAGSVALMESALPLKKCLEDAPHISLSPPIRFSISNRLQSPIGRRALSLQLRCASLAAYGRSASG